MAAPKPKITIPRDLMLKYDKKKDEWYLKQRVDDEGIRASKRKLKRIKDV